LEICIEKKVIPIYKFDDYIINTKGEIFHIDQITGKIININDIIFEYSKKGTPVYRILDLEDNYRFLEIRLDKLVLSTYIGDIEAKIIHKDGDYKNCSLKNIHYELIITKGADYPLYLTINTKKFKLIANKENHNSRFYISYDGIIYDSFFNELVRRTLDKLYYEVKIFEFGTRLHRLMYTTWVGMIKKGKTINHKDGIKFNNHYTNLEVMTLVENLRHAHNTGLMITAVWTETQVRIVCKSMEDNETFKNICIKLDIADDKSKTQLKSLIKKLINGIIWKDISIKYKIENFGDPSVIRKLTDDKVHEVCAMTDNGMTVLEISKVTKIGKPLILGIKSGRIYKDISSQYNFMKNKKKK
jgi:hypothetical protein